MKKEINNEMENDLRPEYDFSQLQNRVRGKYVESYKKGTNLVLLAPDVALALFKVCERGVAATDKGGQDKSSDSTRRLITRSSRARSAVLINPELPLAAPLMRSVGHLMIERKETSYANFHTETTSLAADLGGQ